MWGSLDHQKCPAIRRYGGVDSLPSLCGMASPKATTVESGEGIKSHMRSASSEGWWERVTRLPSPGERGISERDDGVVLQGRDGP